MILFVVKIMRQLQSFLAVIEVEVRWELDAQIFRKGSSWVCTSTLVRHI